MDVFYDDLDTELNVLNAAEHLTLLSDGNARVSLEHGSRPEFISRF